MSTKEVASISVEWVFERLGNACHLTITLRNEAGQKLRESVGRCDWSKRRSAAALWSALAIDAVLSPEVAFSD